MKFLSLIALGILLAVSASAQKTNDVIQKQIRSLKADKMIELSFDGGASKIFAHAENFSDAEARAAHVEAMNFGMAYFYPGTTLSMPPETINLTFWVLTKKPQFGNDTKWIVTLPGETLDLGVVPQYTSKPGNKMEYLNFTIKRSDLAKIAAASGVKFKLGKADLTFTPGHLQMFRDILAISDTK